MPITVSLCSTPWRANVLSRVLDAIRNQTVKPDRIVITYCEFYKRAEQHITTDHLRLLHNQKDCELILSEDYGPITKVYPTSLKYARDIILSVDDDIAIHPQTIQTLLPLLKDKKCTVGFDGVRFVNTFKYTDIIDCKMDYCNVLKGTRGILYYPKVLIGLEQELDKTPGHFYSDDVTICGFLAKNNRRKFAVGNKNPGHQDASRAMALHLNENKDNTNHNQVVQYYKPYFQKENESTRTC